MCLLSFYKNSFPIKTVKNLLNDPNYQKQMHLTMFDKINRNPGITGALGKPLHSTERREGRRGKKNFNVRCHAKSTWPQIGLIFYYTLDISGDQMSADDTFTLAMCTLEAAGTLAAVEGMPWKYQDLLPRNLMLLFEPFLGLISKFCMFSHIEQSLEKAG